MKFIVFLKNTIITHKILLTFIFAVILYSVLAQIWIDADGIFNLVASIKGGNGPFSIYDDWHFGPFYYGWGPFYSWILLLIHPIFNFFGFTVDSIWEGWAFNPFTYYLFKLLTKIPFVLVGGVLLHRLCGLRATILWLFNPLIIWFIILAGLNDIYPAFFLILAIYFLKNDRLLLFTLAIGFGLIAKQTISLVFPCVILMLIFTKKLKSPLYIIILLLPNFIFTIPYKFYSQGYDIWTNDSFWGRLPVHLGYYIERIYFGAIRGIYYTNIVLYSFIIIMLLIKKPRLNLANFCLWTSPIYLIYILSYGTGYERWSVTALPLMLVVTLIFTNLFNKNAYYLFLGFSFLPPLIQFACRDSYFNATAEEYTLFENTTLPFRLLNIFDRPELGTSALSNYMISVQAGIIIAYLFMISYSIYKKTNIELFEKEHRLRLGLKKQLVIACSSISLLVLLVLFFHSHASTAYKYSEFKEQKINVKKGSTYINIYPPSKNKFVSFRIEGVYSNKEPMDKNSIFSAEDIYIDKNLVKINIPESLQKLDRVSLIVYYKCRSKMKIRDIFLKRDIYNKRV